MALTEALPSFRVRQGFLLFQENYVHLPLKESMYAVRPVQALRLLEQKLISTGEPASDLDFHRQVLSIFNSVRDLHTNYSLPAPYNEKTAFLPFQLESYFEDGVRRFLVSHMVGGFEAPPFGPGVEIVRWNGAPIATAVRANADRLAGSNEAARLARGIERMTIRPLILALPPDEDFVLVEYRTSDGDFHEIRLDWMVFTPDATGEGVVDETVFDPRSYAMAVDIEAQMASRAKKSLFAPSVIAKEMALVGKTFTPSKRKVNAGDDIPSGMPGVMSAKTVETSHGEFGYIRIRTFDVNDADEFVDEFVRLAAELPQNGLIIDVRSNGGGLVLAGEQLLQVLSPRRIEPEPLQFINTARNLDLVRKHSPSNFGGFSLMDWLGSMEESISTGASFSRAFPITDVEDANAIGQRYHGPVVLITDAKCYSTTDIFAAGFQDHEIGPILGVDGNTGAGGANVWTLPLLRRLAGNDGPYKSLPADANMRVAIRRTLRVGMRAGTLVEDLGVQPDELYEMTRDDLLNGNKDLIEAAAKLLSDRPVRALNGEISQTGSGDIELSLETKGLARVDVYAGNRPIGAVDVQDGSTSVVIETLGGASFVLLEGFDDDEELAASRRITF